MNDDFFPFEMKASCSVTKRENLPSERSVVIDISSVGSLDFDCPKTKSKTEQLLTRKNKVVRRAKAVIRRLEKQQTEVEEAEEMKIANQIQILRENLKQIGEDVSDSDISHSNVLQEEELETHNSTIIPISDAASNQFEISGLIVSSTSQDPNYLDAQSEEGISDVENMDEKEKNKSGSIIISEELSKSISLEHGDTLHLDDLSTDSSDLEMTPTDVMSASQPICTTERMISNDPLSASMSIKKIYDDDSKAGEDVIYGDSTVWMFVPITDADKEKTLRRRQKEKIRLLPNFSKIAVIMDSQFKLLKKGRKQQMKLSILMSQHKNEHFVILVDPELQIANAVYSLGLHAEKCSKIWGDGDDVLEITNFIKYWKYNSAGQIFEEIEGQFDENVIAFSV